MLENLGQTIKENLRRDRMMFALRIVTGVIFSIFVADFLKIDFAPSTGVITLLTIDQTKKSTFKRIILRIFSFIYTYLYSWMVVDLFKLETTHGFAIAISLVTFTTFLLRWDLTLSVNCVILIQLFLDSKPFTYSLFFNEAGRLLIGVLTAVLVNWIFRAKYDDTNNSDKNLSVGNTHTDLIEKNKDPKT